MSARHKRGGMPLIQRIASTLRTLRVRIIAIVALCWLLPTVVLGVYMSSIFFDALRTKTEQALVAGASHAQELVVQEIDRILDKSRTITYDGLLTEYTAEYWSGMLRYEDFYIKARSYWQRMFQRERSMPFTAAFLLEEPEVFVHTTQHADYVSRFVQSVQARVLEIGETLDTRSLFAVIDGELFHVRNLYNRRLERFGMMVLELDASQLFAPLLDENMIWNGQVDIMLDEYRYTANASYPVDPLQLRQGLYQIGGDLYYGMRVYAPDYDLSYRIRLDSDVVYGQIGEYYRIIALLLLLLLPIEALIMAFIHRHVTNPLMRLAEATTRMAGGELGVTVSATGDDEIGRLGTAFNAMSFQIEHLIDKSYREELALRDARISALQSRINPHFLNNALELMNWQARLDGADAVSQMIEAMSTLINAALDRSEERTVPLHAEEEVADAYFFFVQQRYGDRLQIEKQIAPALRDVPVPRLVIQTLLENAVEHGIGPAGGGRIRLAVYARDGLFYIDVRNNGRVMTPQEKEKVDSLLGDTGRQTPSEHVGIRNINMRLKLIYHGEAALTLSTVEAGETLARITIPYTDNEKQYGDVHK